LRVAVLLLLAMVSPSRLHADPVVSFTLSTSRTFSPDEKPTVHLYAHNVDELEFRVYRVRDPGKFLSQLPELHSFGDRSPWDEKEQIDERTWLERFHDWKHDIWFRIRQFFRGQFSHASRDRMRAKQSGMAKRSRIVGEAQFAQIPLLNDKQLVARWKQEMPPTYVSDSQDLAVDKLAAGLYLVEATDGRYKAYTLLVVSRMALITRTLNGQVMAFAVDRTTGAPRAKVAVSLGFGRETKASAVTDKDGLAQLNAGVSKEEQDNFWVAAKAGVGDGGGGGGGGGEYDDVAIVTPASYGLTGAQGGQWSSYVYTDRPVYRPGHTVQWKAIVRARVANHLELPKVASMHVTVSDGQEHPVFDGDVAMSASGALAGQVVLPATASLGYYTIHVGDPESGIGGDFRVEAYRKPEYQVRVLPGEPRILQGRTTAVTIDSRYFFGEPVANAKVKYKIFQARHYWWDYDADDGSDGGGGDDGGGDSSDGGDSSGGTYVGGADEAAEKTGVLDANGKLTIQVPTQDPGKPDPDKMTSDSSKRYDQDVTVEAAVTDEANREIAGRGHFLATVGSFRIHVEPASYAARQGQPADFNLTATDYDGKPVATKVHLQLFQTWWSAGKSTSKPGATVDTTTDASGHGRVSLTMTDYGTVEAVVSATTPEGRVVTDSAYLYVMGANTTDDNDSYGASTVRIVTDKKTYAPGDTAHVSLISEVADFHALVVATGYTVEFKQVLAAGGRTLTFDLPITGDSQPNVDLTAVFIKDGKLYQAEKQIKVPPAQQRLDIEITPAAQVFQPQQTAVYDVLAKDSTGKGVSADLSFGVVDEAIYSLYPDSSGDIVTRLYPSRYADAEVESSLDFYFSGSAGTKSPMLAERKVTYRPRMAQVKPANDVKQPRVRKAFPDTAFWAASVHTDATGHARVTLTFPDSLTTWRTTVRAVTADSKAGAAINRVLVRKNIIVRMGTPRFMNKGDELSLPVIVHNYLDTAKQVQVSLDVTGLGVVAGAAKSISVPSKGDGVVMWRLKASQIGTAKLVAKAITDAESDALELSFPVEPVGVPKTINAVGVVKDGGDGRAVTAINFPAGTDPAAHTLRVEVSPSIAGSMFSALDYLTTFPYGCTEQTMSSFLPNVIVAETLNKLHLTAHVSQADLTEKVQAGLERLRGYQHDDGGWGWWKEDDSQVFMSAYVVSGLAEAKRTFPIEGPDLTMQQKGIGFLQEQLKQHPRMLPELRAYVVYALAESETRGRLVKGSLDTLYGRRGDLSAEGLAITGLAMLDVTDDRADEIAKLLEKKAEVSGGLAVWTSGYSPLMDGYYDNNAESTAYVLRFLVRADPASPLVAQAAQWLVLNRNDGYWWSSTEQTAMVLFGLADYLAASHELNADFDLDVKVNGASVAHRHFTAADAASGAMLRVDLPAEKLAQANSVEIVKSGMGRAYWAVQGKAYTTEKADYQKGTMSLNLTRDYFKLVPAQKDGKVIYTLQPLNGPVSPGDTLAVHLAINGTAAKYLLLEDPIPAGTEFVEHEDSYPLEARPSVWSYWYTRREFQDDRAAFFADDFSKRQEMFYLLKVVNPGSFAISPAHVEPMYQPEVQATSDALHLDVAVPAGEVQ
jgi:uncharacterized protein YfaS (alpha-2-macroglobulin family)